jgi:hypothetical protein
MRRGKTTQVPTVQVPPVFPVTVRPVENWQIYVDNRRTDPDDRDFSGPDLNGNRVCHVATADAAFRKLPAVWHGSAEIRFMNPGEYPVYTDAVYLGTPIGPNAKSLVIRGGYDEQLVVDTKNTGDDVITRSTLLEDSVIGAVLTGSDGTAISIRGATPGDPFSTIHLQQTMPTVKNYVVHRPAVTLVPKLDPALYPRQAWWLTSHDGSQSNLTLIGIKIAPDPGIRVTFYNVRALCDTCGFSLTGNGGIAAYLYLNSWIYGGNDLLTDPRRRAGVYIHSADPSSLINVYYGSVLGGHLTLQDITVQVALGGEFHPKSLEAKNAPIQILAGGRAVGPWGTPSNPARIRNVARVTSPAGHTTTGDGLLVANGGSIASPSDAINLNIFGCGRDGIRVDNGSSASFGKPGGATGLGSSAPNGTGPDGGFGMNVRNGSRALVGSDTALCGQNYLHGLQVDGTGYEWRVCVGDAPSAGSTGSLVRLSQDFH